MQSAILKILRQREQHASGPSKGQQPGNGNPAFEQTPVQRQNEVAAERRVFVQSKVITSASIWKHAFPEKEHSPPKDLEQMDHDYHPTGENDPEQTCEKGRMQGKPGFQGSVYVQDG